MHRCVKWLCAHLCASFVWHSRHQSTPGAVLPVKLPDWQRLELNNRRIPSQNQLLYIWPSILEHFWLLKWRISDRFHDFISLDIYLYTYQKPLWVQCKGGSDHSHRVATNCASALHCLWVRPSYFCGRSWNDTEIFGILLICP